MAPGSGYGPDTPAAIVVRASWPDETVVRTTQKGKVRVIYKNFPLNSHPWAKTAAYAAECARLQNPLSAEHEVMRTSLLPGLLDTIVYNQNHGATDVRVFEIGKVFRHRPGGNGNVDVEERWEFAGAICGGAQAPHWRGQTARSC